MVWQLNHPNQIEQVLINLIRVNMESHKDMVVAVALAVYYDLLTPPGIINVIFEFKIKFKKK